MTCPNCNGKGCGTCGGDGRVPDWLADSKVNGEKAAKTWRKK
jgi:hypothetical protein